MLECLLLYNYELLQPNLQHLINSNLHALLKVCVHVSSLDFWQQYSVVSLLLQQNLLDVSVQQLQDCCQENRHPMSYLLHSDLQVVHQELRTAVLPRRALQSTFQILCSMSYFCLRRLWSFTSLYSYDFLKNESVV
jgi:hypothetical protein